MFNIEIRIFTQFNINYLKKTYCYSSRFVPKHEPPQDKDIANLEKFLNNRTNVLVLTGAGVSTESGIFLT